MITGPKKLVKMAAFLTNVLNIEKDFTLEIKRKKLSDVSAECLRIDDSEFEINLSKNAVSTDIELLGHEMVHLKQYLEGRLIDRGPIPEGYLYHWEGKPYVCGKLMDDYFLCPWEMEARALEAYLSYRWTSRK